MTMAKSSDSAVLNLGELGEESLNFQPSTATTHSFEGQVPDSALDMDDDDRGEYGDDRAELLGEDQNSDRSTKTMNVFTVSFYSQFFNVDTVDVRRRLTWSVTPRPAFTSEFVRTTIRPNPDIYGPFWVCVTLIFSVAISGNVASYLQAAFKYGDADIKGFRWHYDFHKATLAAAAVFGYAWIVPAVLYAALWHQSSRSGAVSLAELLCVYGYSLAIFIPVSVLWTIQNSTLQWTFAVVGAGISGAVLVLALWNNLINDNVRRNVALVILALVIILHLLLACGFMLYFFHVPATAVSSAKGTELKVSGASGDTATIPKKGDGNATGIIADNPPKVDGGKSAKEGGKNADPKKEEVEVVEEAASNGGSDKDSASDSKIPAEKIPSKELGERRKLSMEENAMRGT